MGMIGVPDEVDAEVTQIHKRMLADGVDVRGIAYNETFVEFWVGTKTEQRAVLAWLPKQIGDYRVQTEVHPSPDPKNVRHLFLRNRR